jgi:hypothetical protein
MEGTIYLLCAVTALACSGLLLRGWLHSRVRLLMWCALFFLALALENAVLFIDLVLTPHIDLAAVRNTVALVGVSALLVGLIWDTK